MTLSSISSSGHQYNSTMGHEWRHGADEIVITLEDETETTLQNAISNNLLSGEVGLTECVVKLNPNSQYPTPNRRVSYCGPWLTERSIFFIFSSKKFLGNSVDYFIAGLFTKLRGRPIYLSLFDSGLSSP